MKITIKDNERAFVYKNGLYKKLLLPGTHRIWSYFGETVAKVKAEGLLNFDGINLPVLRQDPEIEKLIRVVEVPDERLALHFVDGRIKDVLMPGTYAYWNVFEQHTFEIVDTTDPESAGNLPVLYIGYMPAGYVTKLEVSEGEIALLYYNGVFQRTIAAGQYFFWNSNTRINAQKIDMRIRQLDISGQEILTADKVSLRVNFVCSYQVTDPRPHKHSL